MTDQHPTIAFDFVSSDGSKTWPVTANRGESLLDIAWRHQIPMEGACEGAMACSTCHVLITADLLDSLKPASDEEEDMLDITYNVTANSRLGCQILVDEQFNGTKIYLPPDTRNMM